MNLTFIENIGNGGFGVVDKVVDENGETFARKTFQINQGPNFPKHLEENVLKRFTREASIQGAIKHKNIVPVIGSNLRAVPPYFIMPLAIGSLQTDIEKDRTLGGKFMNALMDIIAGLEELHSMAIFHRDLKPANVLRFAGSNGDKGDYYAVGDFGLMSVNQTTLSALTQTGMRMGSDYYTAPEIVKDLRAASAQSDIYSLGCILHDFVGRDARIPCNEIKESSDFGPILLSCTRKEPQRRFKSVSAVRDALLSLGDVNIAPFTPRGAEIFEILNKLPAAITEQEWIVIASYVEDNFDDDDSIAILRKLTIEHLDELTNNHKAIAGRLGLMYARWIREHSFNFAECDGLSIRLQKFINSCAVDVQSECLMAMLYMSTSHNRYYVERKFINMVGHTLDQNLAKRLAVEFRVDGYQACQALSHLTYSIGYDINRLHPVLLETHNEICK